MPSVVMASDSPEDGRADVLRRAGFNVAWAGNLDGVPERLPLIAATGGKADCLVLIGTGATNPFHVAKRVRGLSDDLSFRGLVRVRAVPIVLQLPGPFFEYQEVENVLAPPPLGAKNGADYLPDLVATAIQKWRQRLLQELDYVGFAVSIDPSGHLSINHALRRRRKDMSSKLHRALQQLHDYRNYFNRPDSAEELQRQFGFAPLNPKLAVLIGRRGSDRDKLSTVLDRYLDIEVLTYDDVLSMEAVRLLGELSLADLF